MVASLSLAAMPYLGAAPPPPAPGRSQLLDPAALRDQLLAAERERSAPSDARHAAESRDATATKQQVLAQQRVVAALRLRAADVDVSIAADGIAALAKQRADAEQRLQQRAGALGPLLPLIERLSLYPAETLLAVPATPEAALRGALVLKGVASALEQEARTLKAEQAEIVRLSDEISAHLPALRQAQRTQSSQAADLDKQIAVARAAAHDDPHEAEDEAAGVARKAAGEAAHASNLRGAIAEIEVQQRAAAAETPPRRQVALAHLAEPHPAEAGLVPPGQPSGLPSGLPNIGTPQIGRSPVAGRLLHGFGDPTAAGAAQGVSFEAAPSARVTAPCAGRAVFAGPFRSFGLLLIIDCGGGYHFVLAGLDRLDIDVGRPVQANEPVGTMPPWDPSRTTRRPALYVELRRGVQPIDPQPWLRGQG